MNTSMNVLLAHVSTYNVKTFVLVYEIRDYISTYVHVLPVLHRDAPLSDLGLVD